MVRFTLRRKIGFGHRSLKEDVNLEETLPVVSKAVAAATPSSASSPDRDLSSTDGSGTTGSSDVDQATNVTNKHSSASTSRNEDLISIMSLGVEHRHRTPPTKVHVPYHTQHVSTQPTSQQQQQQQLVQQHQQYGSSSSMILNQNHECSNSNTAFSQSQHYPSIGLCRDDSGVCSATTMTTMTTTGNKEPVWKRRLRHNSTPKRATSAPTATTTTKTTTLVAPPTPSTPISCSTPPNVPTRLLPFNSPSASTAAPVAPATAITTSDNNVSSNSSIPHAPSPEVYTNTTRTATPAEILALRQQQQKEQLRQLQLQVLQRKQEQMQQQLAAHQQRAATATAIAKGALEATTATPDLLTRRLNAVVSPKCVSFDEVSLSQKVVPKKSNSNNGNAENHHINSNHHHHNHHLGQGHQYLRPSTNTRNINNINGNNITTTDNNNNNNTGRGGRYSPQEQVSHQQLAGISRINSSFSDVFKDTTTTRGGYGGGPADGFSLDTPTIYTDTSFTYTDDDTTISSYPRSRASSATGPRRRQQQRRRRNHGSGGGGRGAPRSGATSAASSLGKVEEDEESLSMVGSDGYVCPVAVDTAGLFDDINVVATFISQQSPAACSMIFNNTAAGDEVDEDDATGRSCESTKAESRNTTRTNNNNICSMA